MYMYMYTHGTGKTLTITTTTTIEYDTVFANYSQNNYRQCVQSVGITVICCVILGTV